MRSLAPLSAQIFERLLNLAFPPSCLACRKAVARHGAVCASCWSQLTFIERPYCERLGTPFAQDLGVGGLLSPEAIAEPPVYARARAAVRFDDGPARQLVHRLKYSDRIDFAKPMGRWMARAGAQLLEEADLLIPVPLHRRRLWTRKFNQSGALAASVSRECGVPADYFALSRIKPTIPQVGLTRTRRAENVQGAFHVADEAKFRLIDRNIVLVDDVLTSGATLNAAARVLLRAGAKRVDALVFARVVTGG